MVTIQDTVRRAISIKGPKILMDKKNLCILLEDLSPGLAEEREFIEKVYNDGVGKILFDAYSADEEGKKEYLAEADMYLESQCGFNEKWRRRLLFYFAEVILGREPHHPGVVQEREQARQSREGMGRRFIAAAEPLSGRMAVGNGDFLPKGQEPKTGARMHKVVFRVLSKGERKWDLEVSVSESIVGSEISKNLPGEPLLKILYNEKMDKLGIKNISFDSWTVICPDFSRRECAPRQVQVLEKDMMIRIIAGIVHLNVIDIQ